jgi:hypothetical protein
MLLDDRPLWPFDFFCVAKNNSIFPQITQPNLEEVHFLPIFHPKYLSTLSSPQSSFTLGMVAGTSKLNVE